MRTGRVLPLACVLLPLFYGCGSSTSTTLTAPTDTSARCQPSIQGAQTSFGSAGGTGTLAIGISRECVWRVDSQANWVEITSPREGQGDGSVSYRVLANGEPVGRRGTLAVNESRLDVTQEAAPCGFDVSGVANTIGADGGQLRVDVATHNACRWSASADAPWVTVAPPSGSGNGVVQATVQPNPAGIRSATLTVAGQSRPLTQSARSSPPPPVPAPNPPPPGPAPPGPSCTFQLSPQQREFGANGGTGALDVSAPNGCAWSAASSESWLSITSGASGTGNGRIRYLVAPNVTQNSREATINVNGAVHRVSQDGLSGDDDDDDDDDDDVRVSGRVSALSGSCPNLQFVVRNSIVFTDHTTTFSKGSCGSVVNGTDVEVEGRRQSDGRIRARRVELDK